MRCQSPVRWLSIWTFALTLLGVGPAWAQQEPGDAAVSDATAGTDPDALARYVPAQDLHLYLEFQGFEAHPDAWKKTAASQILNDTKTGAMLGEVFTQIIDQGLLPLPGGKLSGADATALAKQALNAGFVFASYGSTEKPSTIFVIRDAFREENRPALARFLGISGIAGPGLQVASKPGGRRVASNKDAPASGWWVEKNQDLVIASQVDSIISVIDGQANALTNPDRQMLAKADGAFQPVGLAFLEIPSGSLPPAAATLGLDGLKKLNYRWGFEGDSLRSELQIVAPAPRSGLLTLLEQPTFSVGELPPLPEGVEEFAVLSLNLDTTYGSLVDLVRSIGGPESDAAAAFAQIEKAIRDRAHKDLRSDILRQLGPKLTYYTLPSVTSDARAETGADSAPASGGLLTGFQVPRFVVAIDVKDSRKFSATVAELIGVINKQLAEAVAPPREEEHPGGAGSQPKRSSSKRSSQAAEFRMTSVEPPTWLLSMPTSLSALTNLRLTVTMGQEHLILAASPDAAREALAFEEQKDQKSGVPSGDLAQAVEGLPDRLVFLRVHDPSETLSQNLADLPATIQMSLRALASSPAAQLGTASGPSAGAPASGPLSPGAGGAGQAPPPGASGASQPPPGGGGVGLPPTGAPGGPPGRAGGPPGNPAADAGGSPLTMMAHVQIQVPDDSKPDPQAIAGYLFPGSIAVAVEDQGLRIIIREAFPNVGSASAVSSILMLNRFLPGAAAKPQAAGGPGTPPGIGAPPGIPAPGISAPGGGTGRPGSRRSSPD